MLHQGILYQYSNRFACSHLVIPLIIVILLGNIPSGTQAKETLNKFRKPRAGYAAVRNTNTTEYLQEIFIGRCNDYCKDPEAACYQFSCTQLWETFKKAFVSKDQCAISPNDYQEFIDLANIQVPYDTALFWSQSKMLAHDFSKVSNYITLEDTLIGKLADELTWCGKSDSEDVGVSCPPYNSCENPVRSYWNKSSETFARKASGEVQVLLNGSAALPFNESSFFGSVEVPNLNSSQITKMNIWVIYNVGGPKQESCENGSILKLQKILESMNINHSCTENNSKLRLVQCAGISDESAYQACYKDIPCGVSDAALKVSKAIFLLTILIIHQGYRECFMSD